MREGTSLRLKRFEATEKARKVTLLETMISDLSALAVDLAQQIAAEEKRTRISDPRHVAYSTFATAAALRRRTLLTSVEALKPKLDAAKRELNAITIVLRDLELAQRHTRSIDTATPRTIEAAEARQNPAHDQPMLT
jgi:flagellar FliJ protein